MPVLVVGVDNDHDARTAHPDNQPLRLTRLEFDLLQRARRTVNSTVHRLRKKLEHAGAEPIMHSIRGVGWRLTS